MGRLEGAEGTGSGRGGRLGSADHFDEGRKGGACLGRLPRASQADKAAHGGARSQQQGSLPQLEPPSSPGAPACNGLVAGLLGLRECLGVHGAWLRVVEMGGGWRGESDPEVFGQQGPGYARARARTARRGEAAVTRHDVQYRLVSRSRPWHLKGSIAAPASSCALLILSGRCCLQQVSSYIV